VRKLEQIYLSRKLSRKPKTATGKNNKQQFTLAVLITSGACNSHGEDGDGSAG
jgi:hypothetical protein